MAGEKKTVAETKAKRAEVAEPAQGPASAEMEDRETYEPASARNIPRPGTALANPPKTKIGKLTVSLLGDVSSVPSLDEVEKINQEPISQGKAPLMTVIQAVLAKAGGTMHLEELTAKTLKYWNRPLPTTPYTAEQLIYVMVRNADNLRVKE